MTEEFIEIDTKNINQEKTLLEDKLLFDSMIIEKKEISNKPIYQVQSISHTNSALITQIGTAETRPTILLNKFSFRGYKCELVSFVLDDSDIQEGNKTGYFPLLSIIFKRKNSIRFVLSLDFYTQDHNKLKCDIVDFINKKSTLTGIYSIGLKYYKDNKLIREEIDTINKICSHNNMTYFLIKYTTNKKVMDIIIKKN